MQLIESWENLSDANKALLKKILAAAIGLYVLLQLIGFLFPIVLTGGIAYWCYKQYIDPNPRILK